MIEESNVEDRLAFWHLAKEEIQKVCTKHKKGKEVLEAYMTVSDAGDGPGAERVGRRTTAREGLARTGECRRGTRGVLLDKGSETIGISALERIDDALVLEKEEGGHSANTVSLGHCLDSVHINFEEDCVGILFVRGEGADDHTRRQKTRETCELTISKVTCCLSAREMWDKRDIPEMQVADRQVR